jgi:aspartate aminotransferase-like enzyme
VSLASLGLDRGGNEGGQALTFARRGGLGTAENAIGVPAGVDEAGVRKELLEEFDIEIGAGLGPLKGRVWRVGLMGHTSTAENVGVFLDAFGRCLKRP